MIFYFTGTGNGRYAAEKLAESGNDSLCSIGQAFRDGVFTYDLTEEKAIGFVLPVYFGGLPSIVREFIEKVQLLSAESKYIYLVLTCGGMTCDTGNMFVKCMEKRGYKVSAQYGLCMPDNYVLLYDMKTADAVKDTLAKADKELINIAEEIGRRTTGDRIQVKGMLPKVMTALMYPFYNVARKTKKFYATDACTGCRLCTNICPCSAIEMQDNKPIWVKEKCTQCLGCLHRCPVRAIQYGKGTVKRGRYVNPAVDF